MEQLPFFIITSDATSEILPAACYLYNKYWADPDKIFGSTQNFEVLGNHNPAKLMPKNFQFVKIKDDNNIKKWTRYIYNYIKNNHTEDFFIISLDDYLPNDYFKPKIMEELLTFAKNKKVGRIALGRLDVEKWDVAKSFDGYNIIKLKQNSVYRLSCQTSVWNREYFLKYFNKDWTPWELEIQGSKEAKNDGWKIIGTNGEWVFSWQEESALSGRWPNMINILGVRPEDVKVCIEKGWFEPFRLQYGIWYDCKIPFLSKFQTISKKLTKIPKFSEIGYDFKWNLIKPYIRNKTYNRLYFRYKKFYAS